MKIKNNNSTQTIKPGTLHKL